jgi:hypothetical protein
MVARRFTPLLLLVALSSGCAALPNATSALGRHVEVQAALQSAAQQVRRCYRSPRVAGSGRQIVTRLRVRLTPEGELAGLPVLLVQSGVTPANARAARPMAEAAIEAVMRCAPLHLPTEHYANGWSDFVLTFSPVGVA